MLRGTYWKFYWKAGLPKSKFIWVLISFLFCSSCDNTISNFIGLPKLRTDAEGVVLVPPSSADFSVIPPAITGSNLTSYSVSGTCADVEKIDIKLGTTKLGQVACSDGVFTGNLNASAFSDGTFELSLVDEASGKVMQAINIIKDTTPPAAAIINPPTTVSATTVFSFNISTTDTSNYQYKIGAAGAINCATPAGYSIFTSVGTPISADVSALAQGAVRLCLIGKDTYGNTQTSATVYDWTKDTLAPDVSAVTLTLSETDSWSNTQSPTLNWNAAIDSGGNLDHYEIAIGTAAGLSDVKIWTSVGNVVTSVVSSLTLARGNTYHVSLRAVDSAGNISSVVQPASGWTINSELWVTNGNVQTALKSGKTIFLGGSFSQVGPWVGGGLTLNTTDGSIVWPAAGTRPRIGGHIYAVIPDGNNGWYLGGDFSGVGGVSRKNLAHILSDGSLDLAFNVTTNGKVTSLTLSGGNLYVGGEFTQVNGTARTYLAAISTTDFSLITGFNPTINGIVRALTANSSSLYVGGEFTTIDATTRNRIAAFDLPSGGLSTTFNPNANTTVHALHLHSGSLYVGGSFLTIGGANQGALASLDLSTGANISSFAPVVNNTVFAIQRIGSLIYIGGRFSTVAAQARSYIASINAADGSLDTSFNAAANGRVHSIIASGSDLFVGGEFTSIGGQNRQRIALISGGTGNAMTGFNPSMNQGVRALALNGTKLFVGGNFNSINPQDFSNIVALSLTTGQPVAGFSASTNGDVYTIALNGTDLIVGGAFANLNGQPRTGIGVISSTTGTISNAFNPVLGGPFDYGWTTPAVYSLLVDGSNVYVGGQFHSVGGVGRKFLALLSLTDGSLVSGFDANIFSLVDYDAGSVHTISKSGSTLYFGGIFSTISGATQENIAAVSATTGARVATFSPTLAWTSDTATVNKIEVVGTKAYVVGRFSTVNGTTQRCVASLNTTDGTLDMSLTSIFTSDLCNQTYVNVYETSLFLDGTFASISAATGALNSSTLVNSGASTTRSFISGSTLYVSGYHSNLTIMQFGGVGASFIPIDIATGAYLPEF